MEMSVVEPQKQSVNDAIDALERVLRTVAPDASKDKALYHLGRLRMAVAASHQEGVRFAAFTINKTIHDAGQLLGSGCARGHDDAARSPSCRGPRFLERGSRHIEFPLPPIR